MKKFIIGILGFVIIISLAGCLVTDPIEAEENDDNKAPNNQPEETMKENAIVTIKVKDHGTMVLELSYETAPNTVTNFINLAQDGFYDGLIFHRIISGFMIQGGSSNQPSCTIKGEFESNGIDNDLKHERGVISMARTSVKDSATSQFFIMHQNSPHLDGEYAAFGKLIEGFDVLDSIARVQTGFQDRPLEDIVIESLSVDTKGETYGETKCVL